MLTMIILIAGMFLVTYIPRALPAVFVDKMKLNKRLEKFLELIPYTAMTALIFPGILHADETNMRYGVVGGITAVVLSAVKAPLIVIVLGSVAVNMLMYMFL